MNAYNFTKYNKEAEIPGGDYWKFLDTSAETLLRDNIYLDRISQVINEITNEDLKYRMKKKIFNLIMEKGIYFSGISQGLDIFNSDELKQILKNEFDIKIMEYISNQEIIQYRLQNIKEFIFFLNIVNDSEWEYFMITSILNIIKNYPDKSPLVNIIEYNKFNTEIYNKLINDYYSYLPDEYKNFLQMKQDPNYVYNKSLRFINEDIDIGIDPRISIGPEIEVNNDYEIEIDLSSQRGFEDFIVGSDATVPNGNEVTTAKPFHNVKEDIARFCGLCEAMKDVGYYYSEVSQNASGQINLGLDYLDSKEAILNFYEIYGNCEELLYYICNGEGQLFRQDVFVNSRIKPISEIIGERILDEDLSREDVIMLFNNHNYYTGEDKTIPGLQYKKNSVCLRGTNEEDYRLEFRIPNGGCNYRTWIDNIRLFGKMMEVSKRLADMMKKDYLTSEEEELLSLKIDLQDSDLSIEDKLFILMDLLFKDDKIKQIYYSRYINTIKKIKETKSTKYINKNQTHEPNFGEVEFIGQSQSTIVPNDRIMGTFVMGYDPEEGIIIPNKKR